MPDTLVPCSTLSESVARPRSLGSGAGGDEWGANVHMPSQFQGVAHQALEVDALLRHAGEDALVVLVENVVDAEVDAQPLQRSLARLPGEEDVVHVVGVALLADRKSVV